MNKTEMIAAIADKAGLTKKDAEKALKAFTDTVAAERFSWLALVLSKSAREQQGSASTPIHASPLPSRLPRPLSSRAARL